MEPFQIKGEDRHGINVIELSPMIFKRARTGFISQRNQLLLRVQFKLKGADGHYITIRLKTHKAVQT